MKRLSKLFVLIVLALCFTVAVNAQTNEKQNENGKKLKDRPLKITKAAHLDSSVFGRCSMDSQGSEFVVRLRVTFHSSGEITDVSVFNKSGCEYLDKEGMRLAKKIKFKPAIKDGEFLTITKMIEFRASIR